MSDGSPSADAIQRQMQQVRAEMREDVREMVASARELTDWTWYVRSYPWVCIGAAAAVGYLVVPARARPAIAPDAKDLLELAKHQKIFVKVEEPKPKPTLVASLMRMAAGALLQGGLAIVKHQVEQHLRPVPPSPAASSNGNGRGAHYG
jgi:hypothetical protein